MSEINVGIVGTQFMGRAHSNAYLDVAHYFDLLNLPVMRTACDSVEDNLPPFVKQYGWQTTETDYKNLVERDDIDLIDICTSNLTHMPIAIEAAELASEL